jgi:hypothetical protein
MPGSPCSVSRAARRVRNGSRGVNSGRGREGGAGSATGDPTTILWILQIGDQVFCDTTDRLQDGRLAMGGKTGPFITVPRVSFAGTPRREAISGRESVRNLMG